MMFPFLVNIAIPELEQVLKRPHLRPDALVVLNSTTKDPSMPLVKLQHLTIRMDHSPDHFKISPSFILGRNDDVSDPVVELAQLNRTHHLLIIFDVVADDLRRTIVL